MWETPNFLQVQNIQARESLAPLKLGWVGRSRRRSTVTGEVTTHRLVPLRASTSASISKSHGRVISAKLIAEDDAKYLELADSTGANHGAQATTRAAQRDDFP